MGREGVESVFYLLLTYKNFITYTIHLSTGFLLFTYSM